MTRAARLVVDLVVVVGAAAGLVERSHGARFSGVRGGTDRGACAAIYPGLPNDPICTTNWFAGLKHADNLLMIVASLAVAEAESASITAMGNMFKGRREYVAYADRGSLNSQLFSCRRKSASRSQLKNRATTLPLFQEGEAAGVGVLACLT